MYSIFVTGKNRKRKERRPCRKKKGNEDHSFFTQLCLLKLVSVKANIRYIPLQTLKYTWFHWLFFSHLELLYKLANKGYHWQWTHHYIMLANIITLNEGVWYSIAFKILFKLKYLHWMWFIKCQFSEIKDANFFSFHCYAIWQVSMLAKICFESTWLYKLKMTIQTFVTWCKELTS